MRATRRHVRREVGIGMRLPAYYDRVAGEVAEQNVVLDLRVLCGTSHAEAKRRRRLEKEKEEEEIVCVMRSAKFLHGPAMRGRSRGSGGRIVRPLLLFGLLRVHVRRYYRVLLPLRVGTFEFQWT
jgi:hypothetical protein